MMKTKLALFVTVLAAALFGVGCASVPKPDVAHAVKWNGHWYAVFMEQRTIEEARAHCEKLSGHLVIIETEEEDKFVFDLGVSKIGNGHIWLGAHRDPSVNSAVWIWDDGKPISELYQGYALGNTAFSLDRVSLWKMLATFKGNWFGDLPTDDKGHPKKPYICEWE